jgi:hypothetical protein
VKWLSIVMLALFLPSVVVQYNDPNPYYWMLVYLLPAALTVADLMGRQVRWVWGAFAAYLVAALYWSPALLHGASFDLASMRSEAGDEFFEALGLWICALWLGVLSWRRWRALTPLSGDQAARA